MDESSSVKSDPGRKSEDLLWRHLKELPYFRALLRAVEAGFYQEASLPAPSLDVGCGDGHFASAAFERPLEVGIEPGEECLFQIIILPVR